MEKRIKVISTTNPHEWDKCLSQIIFLEKNKKIICHLNPNVINLTKTCQR